jgi:hypothetical protein
LSLDQKTRSSSLPFSPPITRKRPKSPSQASFAQILTPSLPPDPYPPHLPMTHAPFSSADPRKQIPFRNSRSETSGNLTIPMTRGIPMIPQKLRQS